MNKVPPFIQFLSNNPWILAFTVVLTIVSFIFSIYAYQKQKKIKEPTFYIKTFSIVPSSISQTVSDLKIFYKGKEINFLSITRVVFLNKGNDIINQTDISTREPLRIAIKANSNLEIFEAKVIYEKNQSSNGFSIIQKGSDIHFLFDYLAKNEGGVVQIIHTGCLEEDIDIKGNIKGVNNVVLKSLETHDTRLLRRLSVMPSLILAIITILSFFLPLIPFAFVVLRYIYLLDSPLPKEYQTAVERPWQI